MSDVPASLKQQMLGNKDHQVWHFKKKKKSYKLEKC